MLNRPIVGINSAMMERILLRVAKVPQTNIERLHVVVDESFFHCDKVGVCSDAAEKTP